MSRVAPKTRRRSSCAVQHQSELELKCTRAAGWLEQRSGFGLDFQSVMPEPRNATRVASQKSGHGSLKSQGRAISSGRKNLTRQPHVQKISFQGRPISEPDSLMRTSLTRTSLTRTSLTLTSLPRTSLTRISLRLTSLTLTLCFAINLDAGFSEVSNMNRLHMTLGQPFSRADSQVVFGLFTAQLRG
jgi:hypothetical protein